MVIENKEDYESIMFLIDKVFEANNNKETVALLMMVAAVEKYEAIHYQMTSK